MGTHESSVPLVAGTNSSDGVTRSSPPAASTPHSKLTLKYSELDNCTKQNTLLCHTCLITIFLTVIVHRQTTHHSNGYRIPFSSYFGLNVIKSQNEANNLNVSVHTICSEIIKSDLFAIKPTRCTNFTNLFWHETLHSSDSSSVHHQEFIHCTLSNGICHTGTVHTAFEQDQDGTAVPSWFCSKAVYKPEWHIPLLSVQ